MSKNTLFYCLISVVLFCCEQKKTLEPLVLEKYPQQIDSIITEKIKVAYQDDYKINVSVCRSVITEVNDGEEISYLDTNIYDAFVTINKEKSADVWHFQFNNDTELLFHERMR